jgi:hypothetical protein
LRIAGGDDPRGDGGGGGVRGGGGAGDGRGSASGSGIRVAQPAALSSVIRPSNVAAVIENATDCNRKMKDASYRVAFISILPPTAREEKHD